MRSLVIAIGNPLRRDDGVAHRALDLLASSPDLETRALFQLTPEIAQVIAAYDSVIFIDADAGARGLIIRPVERPPWPPVFTHISNPTEIVSLSQMLFGFAGQAFLCRIPVGDLSFGEGLSRRVKALAAEAAAALETLLGDLRVARFV